MEVKDKEERPWGQFECLIETVDYKMKKITVLPGERLSYQSHEHRSEHWVLLCGKAELIINSEKRLLSINEHIYIPKKVKHRIKNIGVKPLVFIEIQVGTYFGEDDIVRYSDDYGRLKAVS